MITMIAITLFWGRLFGLFCTIVGLTMLLRRADTVSAANRIVADPGQTMLAGVIALVWGLAVILSHDIWFGSFLVIGVTLLGWIAAIKGTILLALPAATLQRGFSRLRYDRLYPLLAVITLAIGVLFIFASFIAVPFG